MSAVFFRETLAPGNCLRQIESRWIRSLRCSVATIFTREFSTVVVVPPDRSPMTSVHRSHSLSGSDFLTKDRSSSRCAARIRSAAASLRKRMCFAQQVVQTTLAPAERIKQGFKRFKEETYSQKPELFRQLAAGQHPKFMVIACSDSRVCPTTILGFQPGEAFVVRNIANMVPPPEQAGYPGTSAALEFAVTVLKVENILVIGHSRCGGIEALMSRNVKRSSFIQDWIEIGQPARAATLKTSSQQLVEHQCTKCEKEAVNVSLANLLEFEFVEDAVSSGKLALHGGYYNFVEGSFEYWSFGVNGKSDVSKF